MIRYFAWTLELTSILIVCFVAAEYYVKEYQFDQANVHLSPDDSSPSSFRIKAENAWADGQFEHRLRIKNTGNRTCLISDPRVTSIQISSDDGIDQFDVNEDTGRASICTRQLPDGNRIPPGYSGPLLLMTEVHPSLKLPCSGNTEIEVSLDLSVTDNRTDYSVEVSDSVRLFGHRPS